MTIDMQLVYNAILVLVNIFMAYLAARWGLRTPTPQPAPSPSPTPTPIPNPILPQPDSNPLNKLPFDGALLKLLLEVLAGRRVLLDVTDNDGGIQTFAVETAKVEQK